nr:hypothetical protein [Tanacetum cinerariifolium]
MDALVVRKAWSRIRHFGLQTDVPFLSWAALTVDALAAVTLGGELLKFEDRRRGKCLLRGDLDLETT